MSKALDGVVELLKADGKLAGDPLQHVCVVVSVVQEGLVRRRS